VLSQFSEIILVLLDISAEDFATLIWEIIDKAVQDVDGFILA
jgi:hypothetical protein